MLVERVHVADASEVLYTDMTCDGFFVFVKANVPVSLLVCAPARVLVESRHVFQHNHQVFDAVGGHGLE